MTASLNKVLIIGNLGSDVEMRFIPSGKPVAKFKVATNSKYKSNNEIKEETEWFQVVCWGKLAELANQYLSKGSQVFVEGKNRTRSWVGTDNVKHYTTEVHAISMSFLGKPNAKVQATQEDDGESINPDDIPF